MLWFTLFLITSLIDLYIHDHFYGKNTSLSNKGLPIKGMLVTGILYYLVQEGLLSKEEEKLLEDKSLEEIEGYVSQKGILNQHEWGKLCLTHCETHENVFDIDMPST
ncbi:hypothetical protein [Bacillus sp. CHD6a]|uniref:hypothetical protein n=1 Tax=Bacillus sp. CHD6a TaxID=1643452 RepID=UPI0006CCFB18|nr:hypothetical protein [Bacillus sp. CHD6a]KPB03333.1 hypothetical protein AAV98_17585 [Bacillus sp. CHD6a]